MLSTMPPLRGHGLKFQQMKRSTEFTPDAPIAGAWVEMGVYDKIEGTHKVDAPIAGAWVEINHGLDSER